jgi:hypothetical protein
MPEICRFFGIVIAIFYDDHEPPHFHARYGEHKAVVRIGDSVVMQGSLPPRVMGLVIEWAAMHQKELLEDWGRAKQKNPLLPIEPLQ